MKKNKLILLLLVFTSLSIFAQQRLDFKALRYDEDYSSKSIDTTATFFDKIKYIPLDHHQTLYLSIGGEIRSQYQYFNNEKWGDIAPDNDGFLLTRALLHTDLKYKNHFRLFFQLQSSTAISRIDPSPVERNDLDIHQLFADYNFTLGKNNMTFRFGRQEMLFGSQRLVSTREGPNNRQAFDAAKIIIKNGNFKSDLFYSHYVKNQQGFFDDKTTPNTKFFGVYNVVNQVPVVQNIDFYYLGLKKDKAKFDDAVGDEVRHSLGTRLWGKKFNWNYDFEAVYQFGEIESKQIDAWTLSLNTGYQFESVKFRPIINLKTDLISGDKHYDDNQLQTFNPLFPKGAYFGLASLIGPSNLIDIHPSVILELNKEITFTVDYDLFWRFETKDGIYEANSKLIYSGRGSPEKFIGTQLETFVDYDVKKWLAFRVEGTWFAAKNYLKDVSAGKDILFLATTAYIRF
ncbi:alginate export family protein [Flavobacterium aquidurense]|uniref:alginate export family protein n=1 Tax=Flavobacterium aquidurense TaxID=362413 RepID=UPI00285A1877|nr:alginate export family protein [Flavobacterium aquidurense]MDR7369914.1 hypothetical protein [Flavobacterium aquidurense]